MKIALRQIKAGSGSDVWAENLSKGLNKIGAETSLELYPHF